jgi:hypothetical protein
MSEQHANAAAKSIIMGSRIRAGTPYWTKVQLPAFVILIASRPQKCEPAGSSAWRFLLEGVG